MSKRTADTSSLSVTMQDGAAHFMGDGLWVLCRDEKVARGTRQHSVAISGDDIAALVAGPLEGLSVHLEDGTAEAMGCGVYVLERVEGKGRSRVRHTIALTEEDLEALAA